LNLGRVEISYHVTSNTIFGLLADSLALLVYAVRSQGFVAYSIFYLGGFAFVLVLSSSSISSGKSFDVDS
jgi:hypothetical protein